MQSTSLHDTALQAEAALEQLATGLAKAGVDDATVKSVSDMAHVTRQIVGALGKGQELTGDQQPPAQAPQQQQPNNFHSAAAGLHQDMVASQQPQVAS